MTQRMCTPGELLALSGNYWQACALHTGVALDVFTPLAQTPMTAQTLAAKLAADARALGMLMDALASMGLLAKDGQTYALQLGAAQFLVKDAPGYVGHIIGHHHRLMTSWSLLPETIRTGKRSRTWTMCDDDGRSDFLMGMFNVAMGIAPVVAKAIDLSGKKRFLDLGGGPGTYAIQFCLANPELSATVFDLPGTRPFAEKTAARFGVSDRVDFAVGNYLTDPVPGGFDVAWLSQILHAEGPENAALIVKKATQALKPGGLLFIHEFMLNDAKDGPEHAALFSLNMLLGTKSGQAYSEKELRDMLAHAGATDVVRLNYSGPVDSAILRAVAG